MNQHDFPENQLSWKCLFLSDLELEEFTTKPQIKKMN